MSIVVYSIKGGVGKTTLSVQISQMLDYTYVTNDSHSSAHNLMPEEKGFLVSSEEYEETSGYSGTVCRVVDEQCVQ